MPAEQDKRRYEISWFTAEFVDGGVELAFRAARHRRVVRQTRIAFSTVILVLFALAYTDYLALGLGDAFYALLKSRLALAVLCLLVVFSAGRLWRSLMDGVTPTAIGIIGVAGFLSVTLLRPYEVGWHGMSMMLILFGLYVFLPNRFLFALATALTSSLLFMLLLDAHFHLLGRELLTLAILLTGVNLLGARVAYRHSCGMRLAYASEALRRKMRGRLHRSEASLAGLQAERDAVLNHDPLLGTIDRRHFEHLLRRAVSRCSERGAFGPIGLMLIEVDYFKQVVDTYGVQHRVAILEHLVMLAHGVLRRADGGVAQFAEASFAALLIDCDQNAANRLADELRGALYRTPLRLPETTLCISASIAVAPLLADESADSLRRRAEAALAMARVKGGNRVEQAISGVFIAPLEGGAGDAQNAVPDPALERP
jgi:diguanylate cyclase (GGDEF)-like protein